MAYSVAFARRARKALERIDRRTAGRILTVVEALAADPRPPAARQLKGMAAWRVRVGDYRVIYEVHDDERLVLVLKVGHRKDVYRQT